MAEVDGKVDGQLVVEYKDLHLGEGVYVKTAAITGVCTDPDCRKRGVATTLLRAGLEFAKNDGVACSGLFTTISGPAQRIYSRLGFLDTYGSYRIRPFPVETFYLNCSSIVRPHGQWTS